MMNINGSSEYGEMQVIRSTAMFVWVAVTLTSCAPVKRSEPDPTEMPEMGPTIIPRDDGTYFPTVVGTKWVYRYSTGSKRVLIVNNVEVKDGGNVVTVHELTNNGLSHYHCTMKSSALGLHLLDDRYSEWFPPLWQLKLPCTSGETWIVESVSKPKGEKITFEEPLKFTAYGPEQITVPAGTFQSIRVVRAGQLLRTEETTWYAPGVGIVKVEFGARPPVRPVKEEMVLIYFALGK